MKKNSFISRFIQDQKSRTAVAVTQNTKKPNNSAESKAPKFLLTSKEDFENKIAELIDDLRSTNSTSNETTSNILLTKYSTSIFVNPEYCSVMLAFPAGVKFKSFCEDKQLLFMDRLWLLDKCSSLLPVTNQVIFQQSINNLTNAGFWPSIAFKVVNDAVSKVPVDPLQDFLTVFPENPDIVTDIKYNFILELDNIMSIFMRSVTQEFRNVYSTYKSSLGLLRTTLELVDPENYSKAMSALKIKPNNSTPSPQTPKSST